MITEDMIKVVNAVHNCMMRGANSDLSVLQVNTDWEEISQELLNDDVLLQNECNLSYNEMVKYLIEFCIYVEEELNSSNIISDELYDKLVEKLIDLGEPHIMSTQSTNNFDKRKHLYPELRGSLSKIHFIESKDIPEKDSRKSLEDYLNGVIRQVKDAGKEISSLSISLDMKYDGVSHILECKDNKIEHILTRGDVDNNLGKDITPLFKKFYPTKNDEIDFPLLIDEMGLQLPDVITNGYFSGKYGIKVETYMKSDNYEKYKNDTNAKRCNRRSTVTSICNTFADNADKNDKMRHYLSMKAFQISSDTEIPLSEVDKENWVYIGKINDKHQYLFLSEIHNVSVTDFGGIYEFTNAYIYTAKALAESIKVPIDGIVLTITNLDIISILGRKNDKNTFQAAFKFPAGEDRTIIERVDFQVGSIAGTITPMARLKPIKINGNTITNVTLCNKAKMERLQIREGDEVIIKYDIVPTIFKDDKCKCSDNPLVEFPTNCPACGGDVVDERCVNPNCVVKNIGHILNFIRKNRIANIGINTIEDFVEKGFVRNISDLYRLHQFRDDLYKLQGYGQQSIDNILEGISKARVLYPHQIIGGIGIPNIGFRIMEKVCRNINVLEYIDKLEELYSKLITIKGVSEKTANAIIEGIKSNFDLLNDLTNMIELKKYEEKKVPTEVVCFTNVRDEDFEAFLLNNGIGVSNSMTSKVTTLVIPDNGMQKVSSKLKKARENNIEILEISKAYDKWGYKK